MIEKHLAIKALLLLTRYVLDDTGHIRLSLYYPIAREYPVPAVTSLSLSHLCPNLAAWLADPAKSNSNLK